MKKNSQQKSSQQSVVKKDIKKITFNLNQSSISCFISQKKTNEPPNHIISSSNYNKQLPQKIINLNKLDHLPKSKFIISKSQSSFNNQLLLMQYGQDQVYVDSTKKYQDNSSSPPKNQTENFQENQIVSSCIKVITEETDNTSNPISARYLSVDERNNQIPYIYQSYYQNYLQPGIQRNKRAISFEQTRVFTIDINKIQQDGRSTVMIRNIPNKYTSQMLIQLFSKDQKSKKFDFFYLPIDYKNNCNYGYAFLNFLHPKFIKDFYHQFHGKKWSHFNSEKICHVCYARIQGTTQLSYYFDSSKIQQQRQRRGRALQLNQFDYAQLSSLIQLQRRQF